MPLEDFSNYFNYYTEIEEHFQRARGTGLFLLSPLDWALIESWKESDIPLEAVLKGIDDAFDKWRAKKSKTQAVNSLAYCAQAVLTQAQQTAGTATPPDHKQAEAPFQPAELRAYLKANAEALRTRSEPAFQEIASALDRLAADAESHLGNLEELERTLTALEEKVTSAARLARSAEDLAAARRDFDLQLRPYRSKMSAEQISMLERQFLDRRLLEAYALPRLSLFYFK